MSLESIPKDLPITDPLLFSLLIVLDAVNFQVNFDDGSDRITDKDLPDFEYAVPTWGTKRSSEYPGGNIYIDHTIVCAIWKKKPNQDDCKLKWWQYPLGQKLRKQQNWDVSYKYQFEQWRLETYMQLEQIISGLLRRSNNSDKIGGQRPLYLADIFGWELVDGDVTYVYSIDSTSNKRYGVGATFKLRGRYQNCCPKIDEELLKKSHSQELGFNFEGCL